jgi:hypothetical protein
VVEVFDIARAGRPGVRLEELAITEGSPLAGRSLQELRGPAVPLLVRHPNGQLIANPTHGAPQSWGTPFGGFKQSGIGREMGPEGLKLYTELKSMALGPRGVGVTRQWHGPGLGGVGQTRPALTVRHRMGYGSIRSSVGPRSRPGRLLQCDGVDHHGHNHITVLDHPCGCAGRTRPPSPRTRTPAGGDQQCAKYARSGAGVRILLAVSGSACSARHLWSSPYRRQDRLTVI